MPAIVKKVSLAAGAENANVLQGSPFEFLPYPAQIEIGIVADVNLVTASVTSGTDVLQEDGPVQKAAADTMPKYPDDFILGDVADQGERLAIKVKNGNAGAAVAYVAVRVTQLQG